MNKYLFFIISLIVALIFVAVIDIVGNVYYLGDSYVMEQTSGGEGYLSIQEYKDMIDNGQTVEKDQMPFELTTLEMKIYLTRIIIMVLGVFFAISVGKLIDGKISFSLLIFDDKKNKMNIIRVIIYSAMLISIPFILQTYPADYLLGWLYFFFSLVVWFIFIVWVLNIANAFIVRKENRLKNSIKKGSV